MFIFSFIRTYYLFIYYKIAVINKSKCGKPDTMQAFIALAVFINAIPLLFLFFQLRSISAVKGYYDLINFPLFETHRGTVTGGAIFIWFVSSVITYLICRFRIDFSGIQDRISQSAFFKDEANWKAVVPVCLQFTLIFIFM